MKEISITENMQHKRHVTVWCCYYRYVGWNWLTGVIESFIETFYFMVELSVTGTWSMLEITYIVNKLSGDGTFVPKHKEVGT